MKKILSMLPWAMILVMGIFLFSKKSSEHTNIDELRAKVDSLNSTNTHLLDSISNLQRPIIENTIIYNNETIEKINDIAEYTDFQRDSLWAGYFINSEKDDLPNRYWYILDERSRDISTATARMEKSISD